MKKEEIRLRDPFVLTDIASKKYYLYGSTDENTWHGKGTGFNCYVSTDLKNFEGPFTVFTPPHDFWADENFWAPEVYSYKNKYYMFASFKKEGVCRATQSLVSESPLGPFVPISKEPLTPRAWECLDGTLYVDSSGKPYIVFCHEWVQVQDGQICVLPLTDELSSSEGAPSMLFSASQAPWVQKRIKENRDNMEFYVTDGPFMYKASNGELLLLWSSFSQGGYTIGISRSKSGNIYGPWTQDEEPLFADDGGHGMVFKTFDGKIVLTIHTPNKTMEERPIFIELIEENGKLMLKRT